MTLNTLKWLRFVSPAVMIASFIALFGYLTGLWELSLPKQPEEWAKTVPGVALSILYYLTGLRNLANRYWFEKVNENIRARMVAISGLDDDPTTFSWRAIRPIFYSLVDNDTSLTKKSELAYFNGWIWTTVADLRALSAIFIILSVVMFWFGTAGAQISIFVFLVIFAVSFFASHISTSYHKKIGDQQLEIIELSYQRTLRERLESIASKSSNSSN